MRTGIVRSLAVVIVSTCVAIALNGGGSPAKADNGYSVQYTPEPVIDGGLTKFDFSGVSHPKIVIQPQYLGTDFFETYWLSIKNLDNTYDKTSWTRTDAEGGRFDFNPAYTWDLCKGNGDHTSGYVTILLEGETTTGIARRQLLSDEVFIVNYQNQCKPATGENVPPSDALALSIKSTAATQTVFTMTDSRLASFIPGTSGPYRYSLYLLSGGNANDVLKNDFAYTNGVFTATWDTNTSASDNGSFTFYTDFSNTGTGTHVTGPTLVVQKGAGGVTKSTAGTPPPTATRGGTVTLGPLTFTVPDTSRLHNLSGLSLFVAARDIITEWLFIVASVLAVIALLYSGIMYELSLGDPAKAEKAKKNLGWAVAGIAVLFLMVVLFAILGNLLHNVV